MGEESIQRFFLDCLRQDKSIIRIELKGAGIKAITGQVNGIVRADLKFSCVRALLDNVWSRWLFTENAGGLLSILKSGGRKF